MSKHTSCSHGTSLLLSAGSSSLKTFFNFFFWHLFEVSFVLTIPFFTSRFWVDWRKIFQKKCLALQMLKLGKWKLSQSYNFWKSLHIHVLYALYWWLSENTNFVLQESEGFPVDHYQLFFCLWFLLSLLDTGCSQNYLQIYVLKFLWSLWLQEKNCLRIVMKSSSDSEVSE